MAGSGVVDPDRLATRLVLRKSAVLLQLPYAVLVTALTFLQRVEPLWKEVSQEVGLASLLCMFKHHGKGTIHTSLLRLPGCGGCVLDGGLQG